MKSKRQHRSANPLYSFAILTIIIVLSVLLACTSNDGGSHQQLLQTAVASGMTTPATATTSTSPPVPNTAVVSTNTNSNLPNKPVNNTGQAAASQSESLVRSIMDPSSLITSVLNQAGGNKTHSSNSTNQNSGIGNHSAIALGNTMQTGVVRNIYTLLLAHQIIPPKDFIPLYDTSPYEILNGHLAAKIPCDANSVPSLQILIGHLPDVKPVQLQLVKGFSQPGNICFYHVDLGAATTTHHNNSAVVSVAGGRSQQANKTTTTINTDLVLSNPTADRVILPNTSTVVIGVNEIMPVDVVAAGTNNNNNTNIAPNQSRGSNGQINNLINAMTTSMNNNKPITR
jgi:Ni,Fe-hydrogenase III small subunit